MHKLARFTIGECIDNIIDLRFLNLLLRPYRAVDGK